MKISTKKTILNLSLLGFITFNSSCSNEMDPSDSTGSSSFELSIRRYKEEQENKKVNFSMGLGQSYSNDHLSINLLKKCLDKLSTLERSCSFAMIQVENGFKSFSKGPYQYRQLKEDVLLVANDCAIPDKTSPEFIVEITNIIESYDKVKDFIKNELKLDFSVTSDDKVYDPMLCLWTKSDDPTDLFSRFKNKPVVIQENIGEKIDDFLTVRSKKGLLEKLFLNSFLTQKKEVLKVEGIKIDLKIEIIEGYFMGHKNGQKLSTEEFNLYLKSKYTPLPARGHSDDICPCPDIREGADSVEEGEYMPIYESTVSATRLGYTLAENPHIKNAEDLLKTAQAFREKFQSSISNTNILSSNNSFSSREGLKSFLLEYKPK